MTASKVMIYPALIVSSYLNIACTSETIIARHK